MNKEGLSNAVAVVLIVFFALVTIFIVWWFILPAFKGTGDQVQPGPVCLANSVDVLSCVKVKDKNNNEAYNIAFKPVFGEEVQLNNAVVSLEYADGTASEIKLNKIMTSGGAVSTLILSNKNAISVKVSPIFLLTDGSSKLCGDYSSIECSVSKDSAGGLMQVNNAGISSESVLINYSPNISVSNNLSCDNGRVWGKDMKGIERCVGKCDVGKIWGNDQNGSEMCVWDSAEAWALANQLLSKVQACANAGVQLNPPNHPTEPTNYLCGNDNTYGTWQKLPAGWEWFSYTSGQESDMLTSGGNYLIYMISKDEGLAQIVCGHDANAFAGFCTSDPVHFGGLCRLEAGFSCSRSVGYPDTFK